MGTLQQFEVGHELLLASAHRDPERVAEYARSCQARGIAVLITGAGMAAYLAGALAAHCTVPVIGVPVATVGVDQSQNAALLALQILAVADANLAERLAAYRAKLTADLRQKDAALQATART